MRPTEFQGVILCGPGNDLYPLTQHSGSVSKALLPVCNQPLLDNPLRLAEQLGLAECLVLCQTQKEADDISSWTRRRQSSVKVEVWATADSSQSAPLHPKPVSARNGADHPDHGPDQDLQSEPNDQEEGSGDSEEDEDEDKEEEEEEEAQGHSSTAAEGTIAALRWAATQGLLKSDFVLFSCDVHMDPEHAEEALRSVLDRHRRDDCLLSTLLVQAPEDSKPKDATLLTLIEPTKSLLLDIKEMADFNAEDDLDLRRTPFPRTQVTTALSHSHVFFCSKRVLTLMLALPPSLHSFKDDLVPFLAKCQWQRGLLEKYDLPLPEQSPQQLAILHSSLSYPAQDPAAISASERIHSTAQTPSLAASSGLDQSHGYRLALQPAVKRDEIVAVSVWKRAQGPCIRANTVEAYAELNRVLLPSHASKSAPPSSTTNTRQIGSDSLVGPNLVLGEKSTVKRSVLGKGINVGAAAKISNSILMDNVVVGDNVKLDSCIVAANARIEADVSLTKCEVGSGVEVFAGANAKGEKLAALGE